MVMVGSYADLLSLGRSMTVEIAGQNCKIYYYYYDSNYIQVPVLLLHGVNGNCRNFDSLALFLISNGFNIITLDYPGRGNSEYLKDKELYIHDVYLCVIRDLLQSLEIKKVYCVGTSLGGLLALQLYKKGVKVKALVLNDIGPYVPIERQKKLAGYLYNNYVKFNTLKEVSKYIRFAYAMSGIDLEQDWRHLIRYSVHKENNGSFILSYDKLVVDKLYEDSVSGEVIDLWDDWRYLQYKKVPVQVIRGGLSSLFTTDVLTKMQEIKPDTDVVTFDSLGHAPMLTDIIQKEYILKFLKNIFLH
ncbi:MAG: alpha/beta hydrolase fold family protein [Candidatus Xenolissoclinum pacificiensis L6]|uniref:Alpha/beta hydrolase fold family protein n=1 Tax=Candidatus Xenolissoclinum pacificiensis L6 TaxID=1401685 RepID=W2UZK0_9RICK|nr:MAG: alpha/beta hydrolase fold family protein [Candidatus Xenolissoclinum pacificiensis L6]